jgi:hypothetical protein
MWLERLVRRVLAAEGVGEAEISLTLVDDRRISRLHAEWFDDPSPTDVITFPLSEPANDSLAGDIVVSAETARRRARAQRRRHAWAAGGAPVRGVELEHPRQRVELDFVETNRLLRLVHAADSSRKTASLDCHL